MAPPLAEAAQRALDLALAGPPGLGAGRLVRIDGPAGSGKTTLAEQIATLAPGTPVIHTDDLLTGWDGLPGLAATLGALLRPLVAGEPSSYRRFDWHAGRPAELVAMPTVSLLVLEGVGAGSLTGSGAAGPLVWVEAPHDVRMRRGLERDGDAFAPHWTAWAAAEEQHFTAQRTKERAHLVVDGRGQIVD